MSFLHPLGLLLAGLAAVPVLLHLLRRQTVQRIAFPALRYLRDAEQRTSRSLRLRDLLLLAARVGLLVLLAVAAARPLAGRGDADDHAPTDVILLIDNSASMGRVLDGRTLLDLQLDAVRAALGHATPADRFWVTPSASPPLASGVNAQTAAGVLDSLSVTGAGADLVGRIEEATAAVPVEEGRVREVQLYTDRQASGLVGGPLDLSAWGRVAVSVPDDDPPHNLYVADLRLEPDGPLIPGDPPAAAVRMASDADGAEPTGAGADTVEVRVLVDGGTVAVARTVAGSEVLVSLPDLEPGAHDLGAEGPPSGLRADDVRQVGIVVEPSPAVRFLGDPDGFLATAITTLAAEGRIREADDDAVYVIEGPTERAPSDGRAVLLVPPAELTRLPAFQQRLDALGVPWRLAGRSGTGDLRLAGDGDISGLAEVRIALAHGLERLAAPATEDDSVLLRTGDGAPWLVRGRAGERVYLLLASPLHPDATDLPVSAAMVPFVERLLSHWSRPAAAVARSVEAGETVVLPTRIERLRRPDGETMPAEGGAPWTPRDAGPWVFVLSGETGPIERPVGVNVPAAESDLRAASTDDVRDAFAGSELRLASTPQAWSDAVFGARRPAEATLPVVAAIVLLAVLELVLAAPGRRRRPVEPADAA